MTMTRFRSGSLKLMSPTWDGHVDRNLIFIALYVYFIQINLFTAKRQYFICRRLVAYIHCRPKKKFKHLIMHHSKTSSNSTYPGYGLLGLESLSTPETVGQKCGPGNRTPRPSRSSSERRRRDGRVTYRRRYGHKWPARGFRLCKPCGQLHRLEHAE